MCVNIFRRNSSWTILVARCTLSTQQRTPGNRVTRAGVLARDRYTCAYCGGYGDTLDHVVPESRGGQNTWLNLVAACAPCNGRKDNRTPAEAGMRLLWEPYEPRERNRYRVPAMV